MLRGTKIAFTLILIYQTVSYLFSFTFVTFLNKKEVRSSRVLEIGIIVCCLKKKAKGGIGNCYMNKSSIQFLTDPSKKKKLKNTARETQKTITFHIQYLELKLL